jgi:DNA-directed RNA polymerase specialized sigma24 family protein
MNVHISYRVHKTPQIDKEVTHFLEKLRKRLQVFRPELVHLKGLVEQNSPREGACVSLNLRLPSGQMAVQQSAPTPEAASHAAFEDLLLQLTKHKDLLRNSHKWARRRARGSGIQPQVPFEQTLAAVHLPTASAEDIRSYVNANLGRLSRYVEREIFFRETADQLPAGLITKDEVVDEAVARALADGSERPERLALEPWLYRLAIRAMDDLAVGDGDGESSIHLEESARKQNVRASDEPELQFHQPDETFTKESVIADRRAASPQDVAYSDEMIRLVHLALGRASRSDREAFILHALEGFSVEEVAGITAQSPEKVRSCISAARERVRKSAVLSAQARDRLVQRAGTA